MSTAPRTMMGPRRRSLVPAVSAVVGLMFATAWFVAGRQISRAEQRLEQAQSMERAGELIDLLRQLTQERAKAHAQTLAEDPRLKSTLSAANVDDATILDILQDLQKLNSQTIFAVLSLEGRVKAVIGAPKLMGLDLSSSAVVKAALADETAGAGVWLIEDRVAEIAVSAVRVGDRPVAMLLIGNKVSDAALTKVAQTAGVHLALMIDERLVWSDGALSPAAWASDVMRFEVKGAVPPARFMATPDAKEPAIWRLAFLVPLAALAFAVLAFWRGGVR